MCGICGMVDYRGGVIDHTVLDRMTRSLRHRGPDDMGVDVSGPVGLGQTRLSVLDLSAAGHQPMWSEDRRHALVYNGEVYNFQDLRAQLEAVGFRFRSRSDTEVVLNALIHWGSEAVCRFQGMFAFGFWDAARKRLVLARDPFGIKPLYVTERDGTVVFGSEIKALLKSGRIGRKLGMQGLSEYLWYGVALGTQTLYNGIEKFPAGAVETFDVGGRSRRMYWQPSDVARTSASRPQAIHEVRELLEKAIRSHLVSDVPVGVFLSGGVDSSTIVALASRQYAGRLHTFSVGFDYDRGVNELPRARRVAERFGTDHHELHLRAGHVPDILQRLLAAHDQPFGDAANIPLYQLCAELHGRIKVVLQGDGGDEMFAGYRRYRVMASEDAWRLAARLGTSLCSAWPVGIRRDRLLRFLLAMRENNPATRLALLMSEDSAVKTPEAILSPAMREAVAAFDPFKRYREVHNALADRDAVQRALLTDAAILLPDIFLEKVDRATMAHGVEVRVPFLDLPLAKYAMSLPADYKVHRGVSKWLLRAAMRGTVPDEVLDGPKTGFGVPFKEWLRTSLAGTLREALSDPSVRRRDLLDMAVLERMTTEHVNRRRDNGFLLWKALNLALWCGQCLD